MAHLWIADGEAGGWSLRPLAADAYEVFGGGLAPPAGAPSSDGASRPALLVRRGQGADEQWVLLADSRSAARINGSPLVLGIRALLDRDELVVRDAAAPAPLRCFFSTERLAQVEPLPSGNGPVRCVRCKDVIEPDTTAVRCPACDLWHHQVEGGRKCWTYRPGCASCGHPTQLDGTYRWTPEEL